MSWATVCDFVKNGFELIFQACLVFLFSYSTNKQRLSFLLTYQTLCWREDLAWGVSTNLCNISFTTHLTAHNVRFCQKNCTKSTPQFIFQYYLVICGLVSLRAAVFVKLQADKQDSLSCWWQEWLPTPAELFQHSSGCPLQGS